MKKLVIVGMLAGLFTINSQANDNGDDFWFPNEHGSYQAESVVTNETDKVKVLPSEIMVTDNDDVLLKNKFQGTRQYRSRIVRPQADDYEADEAWQGATQRVEGDMNSLTIDPVVQEPKNDMHTRRPYKLPRR
jgi:nitroimidazol reductase NimA-like FMN-containing flavoprotein (pyridoxamine 5'-phosphate oxidase superfamily)